MKQFQKSKIKKFWKSLDKPLIICYNSYVELRAPLAQLVEQLTLNQWVLGSSPRWCTKRPVGQAVKTPPSHGGDGSSILPRVTNEKRINTVSRAKSVQMAMRFHLFPFRTQKLSSYTPKILRWQRLGKIGLRRHPFVSS